jgi:hypothetical protein
MTLKSNGATGTGRPKTVSGLALALRPGYAGRLLAFQLRLLAIGLRLICGHLVLLSGGPIPLGPGTYIAAHFKNK